MNEISDEQRDKLQTFVDNGKENSALPGMTYEDGIEAVLDVMAENITVEEAVNE